LCDHAIDMPNSEADQYVTMLLWLKERML
jgi:hypothetical protein